MTYHRVGNRSNTTGTTCGAGALTLPENLVFSGVRVTRSMVFYVVFCRSFFVHLSFCSIGHCILSVFLQCTDSDYSFGIVKLTFLPSNLRLTFDTNLLCVPELYEFSQSNWAPLFVIMHDDTLASPLK